MNESDGSLITTCIQYNHDHPVGQGPFSRPFLLPGSQPNNLFGQQTTLRSLSSDSINYLYANQVAILAWNLPPGRSVWPEGSADKLLHWTVRVTGWDITHRPPGKERVVPRKIYVGFLSKIVISHRCHSDCISFANSWHFPSECVRSDLARIQKRFELRFVCTGMWIVDYHESPYCSIS